MSISTFDFAAYEATVRDIYRGMSADEVLSAALDKIREGWMKGELGDGNGNVCMLGALNYACTQREYGDARVSRHADAYREALRLIRNAVMAELKLRGVSLLEIGSCDSDPVKLIPAFNDSDLTTLEDVTLIFKRAIGEAQDDEGDE